MHNYIKNRKYFLYVERSLVCEKCVYIFVRILYI